jgi:predicted TIM-barrel fold metal-dependent hydrolase
MRLLAKQPNMHVKLSGLGTFIRANDSAHIARIVHETVELFDPGRCLYGSNFPIEKLWCSYGELIDAYRGAVAGYSADEQRKLLHDTAERLYRL